MRSRLIAFIALLSTGLGCTPADPARPSVPANDTYAASLGVDLSSMTKYSDDLYYKDVVVGTGTPAVTYGKTIVVTYTGYLTDGRAFDARTGTDSLVRVLDDNNLIAGWTRGLPAGGGMKPGGTRKLVIGSAMAFGSQGGSSGAVTIPPNATVVFDVTLKAVK